LINNKAGFNPLCLVCTQTGF